MAGERGRLRRYVRLLRQDERAGWAALARDLPSLGFDRGEAASLRRDIRSIAPLIKAVRKPVQRAVDKRHKHDREPHPCGFFMCRRMVPHTREDWTWHYRQLRRWKGFRNGPIGKPPHLGPYARREQGIVRRMAIFAEEAPQAARVLGPEGVRAIIEQVRSALPYYRLRRWIQIQYGGKPSRAPSKPLDQLAPRTSRPMKLPYPSPYPPWVSHTPWSRESQTERLRLKPWLKQGGTPTRP